MDEKTWRAQSLQSCKQNNSVKGPRSTVVTEENKSATADHAGRKKRLKWVPGACG